MEEFLESQKNGCESLLLLSQSPPRHPGRHPELTPERVAEVPRMHIADLLSDLFDGEVSLLEQPIGS